MDGSTNWLFGDEAVGRKNGNTGSGEGEYDLPVLKGQLFGTDNAAEGDNGEKDASLTVSQLMVDESGGDFPFDISFNAPASLLSDSTAPNLEAPLTGKMKDLFRFPQDCKKIKESMDTIEKRKAAASPKSPGSRSAHPPGSVSNKASDSGDDALDEGEDESLSGERESLSGE